VEKKREKKGGKEGRGRVGKNRKAMVGAREVAEKKGVEGARGQTGLPDESVRLKRALRGRNDR